jgi:glutaredoxin-related protein
LVKRAKLQSNTTLNLKEKKSKPTLFFVERIVQITNYQQKNIKQKDVVKKTDNAVNVKKKKKASQRGS